MTVPDSVLSSPNHANSPSGSLQEMHTLFLHAPIPMSCTILDDRGKPARTLWNHTWHKLFGYPADSVQDLCAPAFHFWKDEDAYNRFLHQTTLSGEIHNTEAYLLSYDGSQRVVIVSGRMIRLENQVLLIKSYMDITRQREVETELLVFREMVERANDAMVLVEDDRIIECNPATLRLFGLSRDEIIGIHPGRLSPDLQEDGSPSLLEADQLMAAAMAGEARQFLWRHQRSDGTLFIAEVTLNPAKDMPLSGSEKRRRFVGVLRDVTLAQKANRALLQSEMRFRELFELAPVPLCLLATDGRITAINRRWTQLLGYTLEDIPHIRDWWEKAYPDPDYRKKAMALWHKGMDHLATTGEELRPTELTICCRNKESRNLLVGGAMVGEDLMISFYDVTEQRKAQQALESLNTSLESRVEERTMALRTALENLRLTQTELVRSEKLAGLGSLVAGVAHELNTPIGNAVMVASTLKDLTRQFQTACAEGLKRSVLEHFINRWQEAGEIIERNLFRAAELIAGFKQVAVDQSSYQRRTFELGEVLHELRLTLSPTLKRNRVELKDDADPGIYMDSYPGPLTQVLMNIVNNAVIHAFEGGAEGRVRIEGRAIDSDNVRIRVTDNGCGIQPENLTRIFDPFFTTRLGKGGSGLGLHIVYSLVSELLGGSVRMESTPGRGSTLIMDLPLHAPGHPQQENQGSGSITADTRGHHE
ncbi:PAS domain S-box protein [Desulfobotulus sp. H1]|uniref:histidine kinase n=1 Tax=Desulfobotulus pelophilus TaxID=2823377 RepID=A0ABT3NBB0_9BACT|nr:PAS domain S-box protein [Desulfobotulus pelophilus]MCW7754456.1 PAS domain S-box protein [Desulfobotulus pelophilus]